uniref:Uncharacterized protein n=1 Tax=Rhizophora mucronata TaxID=61149 RepID=A0A2P2P5S5_RHIMU
MMQKIKSVWTIISHFPTGDVVKLAFNHKFLDTLI